MFSLFSFSHFKRFTKVKAMFLVAGFVLVGGLSLAYVQMSPSKIFGNFGACVVGPCPAGEVATVVPYENSNGTANQPDLYMDPLVDEFYIDKNEHATIYRRTLTTIPSVENSSYDLYNPSAESGFRYSQTLKKNVPFNDPVDRVINRMPMLTNDLNINSRPGFWYGGTSGPLPSGIGDIDTNGSTILNAGTDYILKVLVPAGVKSANIVLENGESHGFQSGISPVLEGPYIMKDGTGGGTFCVGTNLNEKKWASWRNCNPKKEDMLKPQYFYYKMQAANDGFVLMQIKLQYYIGDVELYKNWLKDRPWNGGTGSFDGLDATDAVNPKSQASPQSDPSSPKILKSEVPNGAVTSDNVVWKLLLDKDTTVKWSSSAEKGGWYDAKGKHSFDWTSFDQKPGDTVQNPKIEEKDGQIQWTLTFPKNIFKNGPNNEPNKFQFRACKADQCGEVLESSFTVGTGTNKALKFDTPFNSGSVDNTSSTSQSSDPIFTATVPSENCSKTAKLDFTITANNVTEPWEVQWKSPEFTKDGVKLSGWKEFFNGAWIEESRPDFAIPKNPVQDNTWKLSLVTANFERANFILRACKTKDRTVCTGEIISNFTIVENGAAGACKSTSTVSFL